MSINLPKFSNNGLELIAYFESFVPSRYKCSAGKMTIGYGHVILPGERFPAIITQQKAMELLTKDVDIRCEAIKHFITGATTRGMFEVIVSLSYNAGISGISESTFLKKHNAGDYKAAEVELLKWCHYTHPVTLERQVSDGLLRRRLAERELYRGGDWKLYKDMKYFRDNKK